MEKRTIAEWRKIRGLSQAALSNRSSVTQANIWKIEAVRRKYIKTETLTKLADALDVTPEEIDLQGMIANEAGKPLKGYTVTPEFLEQLRAGMRAEGLTVGELADAVNLTTEYMSKLTHGKVASISIDTADKIAEYLGFELAASSAPAAEPERQEERSKAVQKKKAEVGAKRKKSKAEQPPEDQPKISYKYQEWEDGSVSFAARKKTKPELIAAVESFLQHITATLDESETYKCKH